MKTRNIVFGVLGAALLFWSCEPNEPDSTYVNTAPVIKNQSFNVKEDIDNTYIIGQVTATDEVDNDKITFSITSDDSGLFEISPSGNLSLIQSNSLNFDIADKHTFTVRAYDGIVGRSAEITVNVEKPDPTIVLDFDSLELYTGEMATLTATTTNADELTIEWTSNNEAIAKVDENGNVNTLNAGIVEITATVGNASASSTITVNPNVYIAGFETIGNISNAVLWKNGNLATLASGNSKANSVFVDKDNNVYVAGYEFINGVKTALLWKNDEDPIVLSNGNGGGAEANAIFVDDTGTTFVAGNEANNGVFNAMLWRNQVGNTISDGLTSANAFDVFLDGNDVYLVGRQRVENENFSKAKLWVNDNVDVDLTDGSSQAEAFSIYVDNGSYYISGYQYIGGSKAMLWQNNNQSTALTNINLGAANSVVVNGSDIYVGGTQTVSQSLDYLPTVWINGSPSPVADSGSVRSVFIYGTDIYLAGYEAPNFNTGIARLWVNGESTDLGFEGQGESVFVK
ncbi:Ig-like domain-containing protein [Flagellimonas iocasae]|uniref:Ig-like domain-containing protein n=1 Tax=Flagellimonas iocasae TaxID=2055905 RepID=A0ABW4XZ50_9FLAO